MITVTVDSLWNGQVGVRDKYINACRVLKEDLFIRHKGDCMLIKFADLETKIRGKSDRPFKDRFSRAMHYLYYFNWRADEEAVPKTTSLFTKTTSLK